MGTSTNVIKIYYILSLTSVFLIIVKLLMQNFLRRYIVLLQNDKWIILGLPHESALARFYYYITLFNF